MHRSVPARAVVRAGAATVAALLATVGAHAQDQSAAQSGDAPGSSVGVLEEVVITSTKREESQQDIPIAISSITARELENQPFNDIRALASLAPGLVLSNPAGFNAAGGGMRGTGTNIILTTQDAPVSFLVDEFALSQVTTQFLQLFDVQQIEVLRGPQGTLQGKNTTGGVISITTKRPVIGEYSANTELSYGQWESGGAIRSVKLAANLPIGDTFALRFAGIIDDAEGYYRNAKTTATFPGEVPLWSAFGIPVGTPVDPSINTNVLGTGERLGGKDVFAGKIKGLWQPSENYEAYFIYEAVRDESDSPPGVSENADTDLLTLLGFPGIQTAGQSDVFNTLITNNGNGINERDGHRVDVDGYYLNQTLGLTSGQIKSITGYREQTERLPSTYTGEAFLTLFDSTRNIERYTFQQELRFASDFDGPFDFVTGANYFKDSFDFRAFFSVGLSALVPTACNPGGANPFIDPQGFVCLDPTDLNDYQFQGTAQDREEYALFWDGSYEFNERWKLTAGVRYSNDTKEFLRFVDGGGPCNQFTRPQDVSPMGAPLGQPGCLDTRSHFISRAGLVPSQFDQRNIPLPITAFGTTVPGGATSYDDRIEEEFSKVTYRGVVSFAPVDDQLVYLSYATGFLSGGFSETCATPERCDYDPETNGSFELGYKSDLLDKRLRLNVAAFYTTYEDLQRAVVATYTQSTGAAGQETVTVNTGEAEVQGVDIEVTWVPTDSISVDAAVSYLDTKYKDAVLPDLRGTNQPIDLGPFTLPFSPEWKANVGVTYDYGLGDGARLVFNGNVNYQAEAETDVFNVPRTQMQERALFNAAITYRDREDRWYASLYGANLTDEVYRVAALPVAGLWNFTNYGPPRSYGVSVGLNFD